MNLKLLLYPRAILKKLRWKGTERIFCLSMQRTGTTSVGDFFRSFGYPCAGWGVSYKNNWSQKWLEGKYKEIFNSVDFMANQVFEDDPWWHSDFYKELHQRFPEASFILFTRNSNDWFNSMMKHSKGKSPGNTAIHAKIYNREDEYAELINKKGAKNNLGEVDNLLQLDDSYRQHYIEIYESRNTAIENYFREKAPNQFIKCDLNDDEKWKQLGEFFDLTVPNNFEVHSNKSK